jgi:HAD superfamily hydrolase (TIGR01509 family)
VSRALRGVTPALLFDLDGTLVDSDGDHLAAFQEVFAPFGIVLDRALYVREIMGAPNPAIGARFLPQLSVPEREQVLDAKEAAYRARVGAMVPTSGAVALLDHADAHGLPCGVVTNAPRANAEKVLAALGLADRFQTLVIGPELAHAKPHPLPYLTGLARLGATASNALAFEDSRSGVRAAAAAGIAVLGITTGLPAEALIAEGAAFAVADFTDPRIYAAIAARI